MPGSPKTTQTTQSKTDPYGPTIGPLNDLVGQLHGQIGNAAPTGNETGALSAMTANAQAGNPYAGGIAGLAGDLLHGGTDRTGMASGAYGDFKSALQPYTTMDTNPYSNPSFVNATSTMSNDIMDRIKGQYARAGYTPTSSGDFGQQVARGISQGVAPTWLQANNDLENRKLGAISGTYGGANTTAGLLSGLDQTALGNRQAGVGVSSAALQAQDSPYVRQMQIEAQRRGLPLQGIGGIENLLLPIAQAGGTQSGSSTSETDVPMWQKILGAGMGSAGILGATGGLGQNGWMYGSGQGASGLLNAAGPLAMMSDRRMKDDVEQVGELYDGTPVYRFRYKGDPVMRIGLMAQDVEKTTPEAIVESGGFKMVDYAKATERAVRAA